MRPIARLLVLCVLLAGCSEAPSGPVKGGGDSVDKAGSAEEPGTDGGAPAGERGNRPAALGEPVTVVDAAGNEVVTVTVESIIPDHACDGDEATLQEPANGHFVGVELVVTAASGLADFENPYGTFTMNLNGKFTIVGSDGVTETNQIVNTSESYLCSADYNQLLDLAVEPGQTYRGVFVLDSANVSGTLIWQPVLTIGGPDPGWEWPY